MKLFRVWLPVAALGGLRLLQAQTSIDLRTQTKSVDFSSAAYTMPVQVGTTASMPVACSVGQLYFASDGAPGRNLQACTAANTWTPTGYAQGAVTPGTCSVGQIYFKTNAPAGQNLYLCTATNTWSQQADSNAIASVFGRTGAVTAQPGDYSYAQISNTPAALPPNGTASGDLSGSYPSPTVEQVNGAVIPAAGVLKANGSRQIIAAVSGTDYAPATSGTAILKANGSGGFGDAIGGTDYQVPLTFLAPFNEAGNSISCVTASSTAAGCLSSGDWSNFNNKQSALTNPVTGTGQAGNLAKFTAGGTIGSATPGSDYAPATPGASLLKGNGSGGFAGASATDVASLFAGCSGTQYLGADGACHAVSSAGYVVLTMGAGAPTSSCAAPSTTNLAVYLDTVNGDQWWCPSANTWKKVLSVTGSGPYQVTGGTGTAPGTPASGSVSCYFDSTANTQICLNSSGNAFTMVQGVPAAPHQFVSNTDAAGIQHLAQPAAADVSGLAPSATTDTTNANNITSGTLNAAMLPAALGSTTSVNGTAIPAAVTLTRTIASGTATLNTSSISSGACATAVAVAAAGVTTTDAISWTPNADITAVTGYAPSSTGGLAVYPYATSGNVNFKVCNPTASSIAPGAVTLNFRVVR